MILALLVCTGGVLCLLIACLRQACQRAAEARYQREDTAWRAEHFARLGRLAASVFHDARNALGALILYTDLLEEAYRESSPVSMADVTAAIVEMKAQLAHLDGLIQDSLSLAHAVHLKRTPQDLGVAVQAWVTEMQPSAVARGVVLHLAGLETVGQVAFHASTLRRVVLNLIHNTLDAMPQSGTVTLESQGTPIDVQLRVRDTGYGIPAACQAQIFEPLYTTKPEGIGSGLYIAKEIVMAHGGQLTVHSVEGQGTTFTVTLPRSVVGEGEERSTRL